MPKSKVVPDLSYAIGLPPEKAIEYFKSKGYTFSWDWYDTWQEAHTKAFTVAKAMRMDVLQDIRGMVQKSLDEGITFQQFKNELEPKLKAKGWWGRQIIGDPLAPPLDKGGIAGGVEVQLGSPHRLKTIYQTNLQTAYNAGRYIEQMDNVDNRPYWQYVAVMDSRTRPAHRILNGKVFRHDDPFWDTHYPPLGFRCFPPGTKVATPGGWRNIETLQSGDPVIGGSGYVKPVVAVHKNPFNGHLVRLTAEGFESAMTPNHRVLTMNGWTRADNIRPGDIVVQIGKNGWVDSPVIEIDKSYSKRSDSKMSLPVEGKSSISPAFYAKTQVWKIDINPVIPQPVVSRNPFFIRSSLVQTEGFTSGAPLDSFNSLEDFRAWSLLHCNLRTIVSVESIPYTGNVFNLSIPTDESYCISLAVVHNCRCRVRALSDKNLKDRGLAVENSKGRLTEQEVLVSKKTGELRPVTVYRDPLTEEKIAPDVGWNYNPGKAAWFPELDKYDYDIARKHIEGGLTGPDFKALFAGRLKGSMPVSVLDENYMKAIGAKTQTVYLSDETLAKNKANHPEIDYPVYQKLPDIIGRAQLIVKDKENTFVFLRIGKEIYYGAVKTTKTGKANFLTSLRLARESDIATIKKKGKVLRDEL